MFNFVTLSIASIGPGLLWLWYFYRMDRYEPEPLKLIFKTFFAGLLLVIPAGLLEQFWKPQLIASIDNGEWINFLVMAFLVVALIEESLKTMVLWWMVGKDKNLNEPADGIIYGITLGLGFASLENLLWASIFGYAVAILRAIVTTLAHASFTGWAGYYIGKYKLKSDAKVTLIWTGFLVALVTHGLYDFALFLKNSLASIFAFVLIAASLFRLYQVLQDQLSKSPFR